MEEQRKAEIEKKKKALTDTIMFTQCNYCFPIVM